MCEFKVYVNGEKVMDDVIFAHMDGEGVLIRDIIGKSKRINNAKIVEVDVLSTSLILGGNDDE